MPSNKEINLPAILELSEYDGNWDNYINAVYNVFRNDFIVSRTKFRTSRVRLYRHPYVNNREYTFYHITNEGKSESERTPDLRRCERIPWLKPIITNCDEWKLYIWENQNRRRRKRICIFLVNPIGTDYLIVLEKRKGYVVLLTAYPIDYPRKKWSLIQEHDEFHKTTTAC